MEYFIEKFNNILDFGENKIDTLYEEFCEYKSLPTRELPDTALTDVLIKSFENEGDDEYRMDVIWYHLYQMTSPIGSSFRFRNLFDIARILLLTPNSNAGIERVYLFVKNENKNNGSDKKKGEEQKKSFTVIGIGKALF